MAAAQFPVVEPIEEVGYKMRPPLLEDVSIEGPLRIPIPHALDTLEQRDAIEEDYNWWRYSKFAAPWLFFLLLLFSLMFVLTALQQVGDIKQIRNGIPRYYQLYVDGAMDTEGGLNKDVRDLRITIIFLTLVPAVLAFAVLAMKPRPKLRKVLMVIYAILFFCGAVLCFVSFGIAEDQKKNASRCYELEFLTNERCEIREGVATAALACEFCLGLASATAFVVLLYTTFTGDFKLLRTGWRQQERDLEQEPIKLSKYNIKAHRVRETRLIYTSVVLLFVIALGIFLTALIVTMHQDHHTVQLRSARGRTSVWFDIPGEQPFDEAGWSTRNTRLRYAMSASGILLVLLNFIPWRSRVIAWLFAFGYFVIGTFCFVIFAFDVHEMRHSRDVGCPDVPYMNLVTDGGINQVAILAPRNLDLNCNNEPFVTTAVFEFILGIAIIIYLLNEYILRWKSVHSQRKYPWFQIHKQETKLDSRRPVRCELTSHVMTAKEYYYKHRFLAGAGTTTSGTSASSITSESLFEPGLVGPPGIPPPVFV